MGAGHGHGKQAQRALLTPTELHPVKSSGLSCLLLGGVQTPLPAPPLCQLRHSIKAKGGGR